MSTAPNLQQLRLEIMQNAEYMISLSLIPDPNGADITNYNNHKKGAYRCTLLEERRQKWKEERRWDNRPIEERIESGWYGGQW